MYRFYTSNDFSLKTAFTNGTYYRGGMTHIFQAFWWDPSNNVYELVFRNDSCHSHLVFHRYRIYYHCIGRQYISHHMCERTTVIPYRQAYFVYASDLLPEELHNPLVIAALDKYDVLDLVLSKVR